MDNAIKWLLILGLAGGLVWFILRNRNRTAVVNAIPSTPSKPANAGEGLQEKIGALTGVPVKQIGDLAQKAPTLLKVAVFPVGATAVVANALENPGAVKDKLLSVGKKTLSVSKSAVSSTGSAVKNVAKKLNPFSW